MITAVLCWLVFYSFIGICHRPQGVSERGNVLGNAILAAWMVYAVVCAVVVNS